MRNSPPASQILSDRPNSAYGSNKLKIEGSNDKYPTQALKRNEGSRSRNGSSNNQNVNRRNTGKFSPSASVQRRDFSQNSLDRQPRKNQPNNCGLLRPENQLIIGFTSFEQNYAQNKNQTSANVVRFTTTDKSSNKILDFCLLNY